jgi:hypothetical protein
MLGGELGGGQSWRRAGRRSGRRHGSLEDLLDVHFTILIRGVLCVASGEEETVDRVALDRPLREPIDGTAAGLGETCSLTRLRRDGGFRVRLLLVPGFAVAGALDLVVVHFETLLKLVNAGPSLGAIHKLVRRCCGGCAHLTDDNTRVNGRTNANTVLHLLAFVALLDRAGIVIGYNNRKPVVVRRGGVNRCVTTLKESALIGLVTLDAFGGVFTVVAAVVAGVNGGRDTGPEGRGKGGGL